MAECPVMVGVAGWSYDDWNDVVYPRGERDKLAWMAEYFDCIEINSSFYRPFTAGMAARWVRSVAPNPRFRFTAKLWQRFTHQADTPWTPAEVAMFADGVRCLDEGGRLSALLVQFPFYFRDEEASRDILRRIADDFSPWPRVLEVRDQSWLRPDALRFIAGLGYSVACLDMPLTRSSFSAWDHLVGPIGYLRMHGRNREKWFAKGAGVEEKYDYLYSESELSRILERISAIREKVQALFVIWNNHPRGQGAVNALQTSHALTAAPVRVPALLRKAYPQLDAIARPEPPQGLFG